MMIQNFFMDIFMLFFNLYLKVVFMFRITYQNYNLLYIFKDNVISFDVRPVNFY